MNGNRNVRPEFARELAPLEGWQLAHFSGAEQSDPRISGRTADPDGDGMVNLREFLSGTDPRNPRIRPRISAVVEDGGIEILWVRSSQLSERTASWSLELSPDLTAWQGSVLAPISVIADGEETLVLRSSDSVTDVRYARLRVELE